MATLIPMMQISDFHKLEVHQLRRLKSCEVYDGDDYVFTFVNGGVDASGFLRIQTESRSQTANGVCGETLETILGDREKTPYEKRVEALAHAREAKQLKKQLMEVTHG